MPISNSFPPDSKSKLHKQIFDLHPKVCKFCSLVQLDHKISPKTLFPSDYLYFSSYSTSWLRHSERFANEAIEEFSITKSDLVVEIASNDGYLLQYFLRKQIKVFGVEPASGVANIAIDKGIPTQVSFFGLKVAKEMRASGVSPKLLIANNVLAHVPDLNDFLSGFNALMSAESVATFEFPLLKNLIKEVQFDTVYHEHFSYLSLTALIPIFRQNGLLIFKVKEINTHGGSARIYVCKTEALRVIDSSVEAVLGEEFKYDPRNIQVSEEFRQKVLKIREDLLGQIGEIKMKSLKIAAYGAAAKGNTLLNFCGVTSNDISYVVDMNTSKQSKFLPGSKIPITDYKYLLENPPDVLLVLPWNIIDEISKQLQKSNLGHIKLLKAIPKVGYLN
jgi:hypothetical protein